MVSVDTGQIVSPNVSVLKLRDEFDMWWENLFVRRSDIISNLLGAQVEFYALHEWRIVQTESESPLPRAYRIKQSRRHEGIAPLILKRRH
jgi:hypothetical protein